MPHRCVARCDERSSHDRVATGPSVEQLSCHGENSCSSYFRTAVLPMVQELHNRWSDSYCSSIGSCDAIPLYRCAPSRETVVVGVYRACFQELSYATVLICGTPQCTRPEETLKMWLDIEEVAMPLLHFVHEFRQQRRYMQFQR